MVNPVSDSSIDPLVPAVDTSDVPATTPVTDDQQDDSIALKKSALDLMAQDIFSRIEPEDIASLIKVNPSGQDSGGYTPFDVVNQASGGSDTSSAASL